MPIVSQSPTYNLKAMLRKTGIKADVLRAWERRYELPVPQRTPGGHRLYSDYDIETVKWLRARQDEGLSISRAVELWKEHIAAGQDPLENFSPPFPQPVPDRFPATETRIASFRKRWLEANLAFDTVRVDEILNQAFAIYPVETVCTEIIQQGISEIGNYWVLGQASVQQEHFASALANRRLETLISATPRPTRRETILVGCPPGERHTFSLLMLSLFLSRKGFNVIYLGADVPLEQLKETYALTQAELIVLAAQQLITAAPLQSTAVELQKQGVALAYGGLIFNQVPELRERIPAHFLGESLDDAIGLIERLAVAPIVFSTAISDNETYRKVAGLYREKRPFIELAVLEMLSMDGMHINYLHETNIYFGNALSAALDLGDPAFLQSDLEWVRGLLSGRQMSTDSLTPYLAAYSQSIQRELGQAGAPLTTWMNTYISR
jgi:DNA-binding transcriptional MerR regulator